MVDCIVEFCIFVDFCLAVLLVPGTAGSGERRQSVEVPNNKCGFLVLAFKFFYIHFEGQVFGVYIVKIVTSFWRIDPFITI